MGGTRLRWSAVVLAAAVVVGVVVVPTSPAGAAVGDVTLFNTAPVPINGGMTAGPDGQLWFVSGDGAIAEINPLTRAVTRHANAGIVGQAGGLTVGGDGNLWVTVPGNNTIARFNPTTNGFTFFASGVIFPLGITTAADGSLWYTTGSGSAQRMLTNGLLGANTGFIGTTLDIDLGPDGNIWIATNTAPAQLFRINPISGVKTSIVSPVSSRIPTSTTIGPDGHLWFTYDASPTAGVGRLVTATNTWTFFPKAGIEHPTAIVAGADRALWFNSAANRRLGRSTTGGTITLYPQISPAGSNSRTPTDLTAASDGNVWFFATTRIGRILVGPPRCNGRAITVDLAASQSPTAGADVILGTAGPETIDALGGADVVCSGAGVDTVNGGAGNDVILGQEGNDTLNGQTQNDTLNGGPGGDRLNGSTGSDTCNGSTGTDSQSGCERRTSIP